MNVTPREALAMVERVVRADTGVEEGMRRLAAYCQVKHPSPVWGEILALDIRSDIRALRSWLEEVMVEEPPDPRIEALWFGLYDAILRNGREYCAMYVSGATRFDPADRTAEWAEWAPDAYMPASRYAKSEVLQEISNLAHGAGLEARELAAQVLCLGYACLAIREVCASMNRSIFLGGRPSRAVAVGFDGGGHVVVRTLDSPPPEDA
jgi:hypothetical protein